jgi:hypothetical protein
MTDRPPMNLPPRPLELRFRPSFAARVGLGAYVVCFFLPGSVAGVISLVHAPFSIAMLAITLGFAVALAWGIWQLGRPKYIVTNRAIGIATKLGTREVPLSGVVRVVRRKVPGRRGRMVPSADWLDLYDADDAERARLDLLWLADPNEFERAVRRATNTW